MWIVSVGGKAFVWKRLDQDASAMPGSPASNLKNVLIAWEE